MEYDYEKNIQYLIDRLDNKLKYSNMGSFNTAYGQGCMDTYEYISNELKDILNHIPMGFEPEEIKDEF